MNNTRRTVLILALVLVFGAGSHPPASEVDSKEARIRELLDLTGAGELGVQAMHGMIEPMKQAMPEVPAEWWERFSAEVNPDDLNDLVVPIYEKRLTDAEIDAMLAFYRTPEGQSILSKLPVIMQESMTVGQAWGRDLAERMFRELTADGFELPPGLQS